MPKQSSRLESAVIATIATGFIIWSGFFIYRSSVAAFDGRQYYCLFDDAMISMRYAWNLAHGMGLIWNAGERVAGYSNLLMTLLMAVPALVLDKSAAVLFVQIAGVGFMLGTAWLSLRIADHILRGQGGGAGALTRVLTFGFSLAYYPLAYWSLMGMETGLLTVLLLSGVLSALNYAESQKPMHLLVMGLSLGLAFLTRYDSLVFAAAIYGYAAWSTPDLMADRKALLRLAAAAGIYALFVVCQFALNRVYYGEWMPNTYTLKMVGYPILERLARGLRYAAAYVREMSVMLAVAAAGVILRFRREALLLLALAVAAVAEQVYVGGDPWSYWRIMAPTVPLLVVLAIGGAQTLARQGLHTPIAVGGAVSAVLVLGMAWANWRFFPELSLQEPAYQVLANQRYVNVGLAVSQVTTDDATVGVFWAGSIPYYTGRSAIDFLGKSDRYIAHLPPHKISLPGHDKYDLDYSIKTLLPTFVQYFKHRDVDLTEWAKTKYALVEYDGITMNLLRDSPDVLWDKVSILRP